MKLILQAEAGECGLAALGMVASSFGVQVHLHQLRRQFGAGLKGTNLERLIRHAAAMGFSGRPLRVDIDELKDLQTPCILHWDLNHFVVLKKASRNTIEILDPAVGKRKLSITEASKHFTGVALELTPTTSIELKPQEPKPTLSALTGRISGLWRSMLHIFAVAAALEVFAIIAPLLQQMVVDDVLTSGDHDLLTVLVLGFGLLLVVQTAVSIARSWMVIILGQTLSLQWAGNVFRHLIHLPVSFFERRHLGDITSRFGAIQAIQRTLTTAVVEAVLDGVMTIAALAMMLVYSPRLAAVTLSAVGLYVLLRLSFYAPFRNAAAERLVVAARESTYFIETLRAIAPLKLFGREEARRTRWQNLIVDVQNRDFQTAKMNMAFSIGNTFIFSAENLAVLWLGARQIMEGTTNKGADVSGSLTVGMLFAYMSFKGQFSSRFSALINYAIDLKMLSLHAERLADICLEPPENDDLPVNDLSHLVPCLELRSVSFRYGDGEPWVLKDVCLKIEAGENVALVGASGSGKTTLLKIILGLLNPTEGEVFYGGIPIRQIGLSNYRSQIGTVMQDDALLAGSLADNISFFDLHPDQVRVESCARMAQIHVDISCMPMGYNTLIGDLGSGLSGGQKQRLLLARALYKAPRVLVLDEATSHLDIGNECAVNNSLGQLALTRLIVAHRPETIASAQRIAELRAGRILG